MLQCTKHRRRWFKLFNVSCASLFAIFALPLLSELVESANEGWVKGQWLGENAHYGRSPYSKNPIDPKSPPPEKPQGKYLWTSMQNKIVQETVNVITAITLKETNFTTCTPSTINSYQTSFIQIVVKNFSLINIDSIPWNIMCEFTQSGSLKSKSFTHKSHTDPFYGPNTSKHRSYFLYKSPATEFQSEMMVLPNKHWLERIIYEQRPGTSLESVQSDFITIEGRKPNVDLDKDDVKELKGDLRIVFMGNIKPGAFKTNAFKAFLERTNRPLFLQFDLSNPESALKVLDRNVFKPVLEARPEHKNERWSNFPEGEDYLPAYVPRRPGKWRGPSISSPPYNMFSIDCSNNDNLWLKEYSLAKLGGSAEFFRPLNFKCGENNLNVNLYKDWFTEEERKNLKEVKLPDDENGDKNPSVPTGLDTWIWIVLGFVLVVLLVVSGIYYFVFYRSDSPNDATTSGMASNMSRSRTSSVSGQQTVRSGIRPTASGTPRSKLISRSVSSRSGRSKVRGSSLAGSRVSAASKSRSVSRSRSRAGSLPKSERTSGISSLSPSRSISPSRAVSSVSK